MQTVPHPESHVARDEECLSGGLPIVHIFSDVAESGQLFVHAVVGRPHPFLVVVGAHGFDEGAVLRRDGVEVAVSVVAEVVLVVVKSGPRAFGFHEGFAREQVSGFKVAPEGVAPDEGALLTAAQLVHHEAHPLQEGFVLRLVGLVAGGVVGQGEGREPVSRAVSLELGGGGVPSVGDGHPFGRQSVGVVVVVELL